MDVSLILSNAITKSPAVARIAGRTASQQTIATVALYCVLPEWRNKELSPDIFEILGFKRIGS